MRLDTVSVYYVSLRMMDVAVVYFDIGIIAECARENITSFKQFTFAVVFLGTNTFR